MKICLICIEGRKLADAKPDFANDLCSEALLQFSQDFRFRDLLELVMERGLENANKQNTGSQVHWCGMGRDKFTYDLFPGIDHFSLAQTFTQAQLLHQLRDQISGRLPAVGPGFVSRQTAPFCDDSSPEGRVHDDERVNTSAACCSAECSARSGIWPRCGGRSESHARSRSRRSPCRSRARRRPRFSPGP